MKNVIINGKALMQFLEKIDFIEIDTWEAREAKVYPEKRRNNFLNLLKNAPIWNEDDLIYFKEQSSKISNWRTS
jgi:hypothetical protein